MAERSIVGLQRALESGRATARSLVEASLTRVEELDRRGPALNSIIERNPDAMAIAETLDEERRARGPRGPLHGIPVMIKDNIDTADRMQTSAGSLALVGAPALQDAAIVARLRQAGAVLLGKTNLSEWANFRSSRSTSGWSSRGGLTRNPYVLDRNPSGSSSGSAVAVSAGLCAVAVGTETNGSIVSPCSINGVVGIKPTVGLVSRAGIVPIAHSQDTAGPMARTVADAALLLGALAGRDLRDPATLEGPGPDPEGYARHLRPDGMGGTRIGVARRLFGSDRRVVRLMEDALDAMRQLGAEIVDPADIETADALGEPEGQVLVYEFGNDLDAYLAQRVGVPVRSLDDVIAFNETHRAEAMPYFGQELMLKAQARGHLNEPAYLEAAAAARRLAREEGIDATLARHRLDAIVAPTGGPAWVTDLVNGDRFTGGSSSPAAVAGYPSITVPMGAVCGLPVGISFTGGAYQEGMLIRLAYAYEQATQHRRAPQFLTTLTV